MFESEGRMGLDGKFAFFFFFNDVMIAFFGSIFLFFFSFDDRQILGSRVVSSINCMALLG